jgi:transcriptional repressor NrdR
VTERRLVSVPAPWHPATVGTAGIRSLGRVAVVVASGVSPSDRTGTSVGVVRCPQCSSNDDKVVDSRTADDGGAIRRRRECLGCGHRFTTFERVEEQPLLVLKRSGDAMPFDRMRIEAGVAAAAKGRPVSSEQLTSLAQEIEEEVRLEGPDVSTERIGRAVLDRLRVLDEVTYVRFASVYKDFDEAEDFARELQALTKSTEPKRH